MTTRTIRKATVEDVPALTHILNDAVAYKFSHGDSAWGKVGWTEMGVQQSLDRSEVYVIEQDDMRVATMSLSWQDEKYWGLKSRSPVMCTGLPCGMASTASDLAASRSIGAQIR